MPTNAGEMTQTPGGNPQWTAADGKYLYGYANLPSIFAPRPHTGVSTGTRRDYWRRVQGFAGTRGIGGWMMRIPYDPSATWFISTADDSSETTLSNPPTPQKPPPGVK